MYTRFFDKSINDEELMRFKSLLIDAIHIAIKNNKLEDAEKLNSILNVVEMKLNGLVNLDDLKFKLANLD